MGSGVKGQRVEGMGQKGILGGLDSGTTGFLRDEDEEPGPAKPWQSFPVMEFARAKAQPTKELR